MTEFFIVIGRSYEDLEVYGSKGTIFLGKKGALKIFLDVVRSHLIIICGDRGSGKSYTMGVIAEGLANLPEEVRDKISTLLIDTMGIFYTMKYPNERDEELLKEWGLKPKGLNVRVFIPKGYEESFKDKGVPYDFTYSFKPSDLEAMDWCLAFDLKMTDPAAILIQKIVGKLRETRGEDYTIDDMIELAEKDKTASRDAKNLAINMLLSAKNWGLFYEEEFKVSKLIKPGYVNVLDVSCYTEVTGGWSVRALVLGLVAREIFKERMVARRLEELIEIGEISEAEVEKIPMVWMMIDEAHQFLPKEGVTPATAPLLQWIREGRQPGLTLILTTQRPGELHPDALSQSDVVIAHRLTAKPDIDALGRIIMITTPENIGQLMRRLERIKGIAIVLDANQEKIYSMRVRPRTSWHGGGTPSALKTEKF